MWATVLMGPDHLKKKIKRNVRTKRLCRPRRYSSVLKTECAWSVTNFLVALFICSNIIYICVLPMWATVLMGPDHLKKKIKRNVRTKRLCRPRRYSSVLKTECAWSVTNFLVALFIYLFFCLMERSTIFRRSIRLKQTERMVGRSKSIQTN